MDVPSEPNSLPLPVAGEGRGEGQRPTLTLIAAMDRNRLIGVGGVRMPWHLPADLQHFKRTTLGRPVIMGRRTHESIGRVLPGRLNIVLTRGRKAGGDGAGGRSAVAPDPIPGQLDTAASLDDALARAAAWLADHPDAPSEVFVIGGAEIYAQALPRADRLVLTEIDAVFQGDVYFPEFRTGPAGWVEVARDTRRGDGYDYAFVSYRRSAAR